MSCLRFLLLALLIPLFLVSCKSAPKAPAGGNASQEIPPMAPALVKQAMQQPEAPEGSSKQYWEERTTEHRPDGSIIITERKAGTELGGSQDWVAALKEYFKASYFRGLFIALALVVASGAAFHKGWPILGAVLLCGAGASILVAWWAGILAALGGLLLFVGWQAALAQAGPLANLGGKA